MAIELGESIGTELARLYAEWEEANAIAATLLNTRSPGAPLSGNRLEELRKAEAKAAALVTRYRAAAAGRR